MKWLEIIELRAADCNREQLDPMLNNLMKETAQEGVNHVTVVYNHAVIKNGFCIHLKHDTMEVESGGSQMGLSILANLKEYGLVNHSIWIERRL